MSYSESLTQTYTIADIGKVIDCFAADLDMTSQSTGLLNRDLVKQYAADVKAKAQKGYLLEANIVLRDSSGKVIRAAKYEVNTEAGSLVASRPGNNRWPPRREASLASCCATARNGVNLPIRSEHLLTRRSTSTGSRRTRTFLFRRSPAMQTGTMSATAGA